MINSKINFRTIIVMFTLAVMSAASVYVFLNKASAAGFNGTIYTTTFEGLSVNENTYSSKDAVYISGGPQNQNANGLPDGTYYFQVTDPSGATLLSTDQAECRQLTVFNGRVVGVAGPCPHSTGIPNESNGSIPVKLAPFADTPNSGSQYKVWLIKQAGTTVASDGMHLNFSNNNAKTDNFKVVFVPCTNCGPTALLAGRKFYDANANGLFDESEVAVEGVQILIVAGATETIVTTNEAGIWSTTVPTGSEYTVLEFLPFTGPDGEPGSYWQQTAPAANNEGFQGYQGTANGDQLNLNFGNICYKPDANGHPAASAEPCPVSDVPPPEPTPTPTPTPCPDCDTTSVLSGTKYYDSNKNGLFNAGEVPVAGVRILVTLTDGDGVTTQTYVTTDASGNWSLTVPIGAQYVITEDFLLTNPETEPDGYWEQTGPTVSGEEGFPGYMGTVSSEDQGGLNFGNVCYHYDSEGNSVQQSTPCSVWYPPPPPTPTPTPRDNQ